MSQPPQEISKIQYLEQSNKRELLEWCTFFDIQMFDIKIRNHEILKMSSDCNPFSLGAN